MRHRRTIGGVLAVATALLMVLPGFGGFGPRALAQTADDKSKAEKSNIDAQIETLKEQVSEASAEETRLLGLIDESASRLSVLDGKVADFDGQIADVQADVDAAQSRLDALEVERLHTETRLAEATVQLAAAKEELAKQAIAAYTGQSEAARYAGMLLGAGSMDELVSRRSYLKAVVGSQADAIADNERLRNQVSDLQDQLQKSRDAAVVQRNVVAGERDQLQAARDAQNAVRQDAAVELASQEQLKAEVVSRKDEFLAEQAVLEQESAAIAATLRQRAAARAAGNPDATVIPAGSGIFLYPVPGAPITSPFGYRIHPIYGTSILHQGIDFGADTGDPIQAAADGVVASAGSLGGYGNATIIEHSGGLATLYGHQSQILVSEGETVTAGEIIGRVGCTGACTGPHVHFEVRVDGEPVDPMGYLS